MRSFKIGAGVVGFIIVLGLLFLLLGYATFSVVNK